MIGSGALPVERSQIFELMSELQLYGMKAAFDEIMATAIRRHQEPQSIVGELLKAEIADKTARSIKYQLAVAKLPLAKELADFEFAGTPINEPLVRELAGGGFISRQRNVVFIGGTGTGKSHLAIAIARSCIRSGARGRFYNAVDLVNRLENEARSGRQGYLASRHHSAIALSDRLRRFFIVLTWTVNFPRRLRAHLCVKPRKSKVAGFLPVRSALARACRPNARRRVFSGWSVNPNLANRLGSTCSTFSASS
jgi:hypothetical protein